MGRVVQFRYVLPLCVAALCISIIYGAWNPPPIQSLIGPREQLATEFPTVLVHSDASAWSDRQRAAQPSKSRWIAPAVPLPGHAEWVWMIVIALPGALAPVPFDIASQKHPDSWIGAHHLEAEVVCLGVLAMVIWYFLGRFVDDLLHWEKVRRPCLLDLIYALLAPITPVLATLAFFFAKHSAEDHAMLRIAVAWSFVSLVVLGSRGRQLIVWLRSRRIPIGALNQSENAKA
jgi:hypothetical protein